MISCAPRLKKDSGPTWKSVSIHWTDSDMNRLVPVDGLPWIRTTDKAKLFNKNGPLRVVATYRTTDGVDPKTEYRHVSMIADAIEQYVLVKIVMPKDVSAKPGADWPKFRVWAFLQPPIIGRDKKRRDANGGYVVDDIPRAGWFEAVVDGKTMTAEEIDYSKGHKSPAGKKPLKVTGERDASDPRVVRFKICARVANNESEAELKEKAQKLRKKNQDVSLVEAGSYLKVWVRNEERTWPQKPLDDDSEKIVQSMADADSIKPGSGTDPRKFRNHTWKRSRLATHKNIAKGKEPDKNLLYVGLYPAHVIERIEKFEEKIADVEEHKIHPLDWLLTVIAWTLLSQGAKGLRNSVATNQKAKLNKSKSPVGIGDESPHSRATKLIVDLVNSAQLSELFASYAVKGYDKNFLDVMATVEAAQVHQAKWYSSTKTLLDLIFKASMLSDLKSFEQHQLQKTLEEIDKELNPSKKKSFKDCIAKDMLAWGRNWRENSFTASVKLLEDKADKTIPKTPSPLPLPFLAWLSWYVKLEAEANLKLNFAVSCSKEGDVEVKAGLEGTGTGTAKIGLQAIWARVGDEIAGDVGKEMPGPEGELLQKIVQLVNLELSLKAAISPSASAEVTAKFSASGPREDAWKVKLDANFSCPLEFNLSVFSWSYDTFNGKVWDLNKSQGAFLSDVVAFGKRKPKWATVIAWGESLFDPVCYVTSDRKDHNLAVAFGAVVPLSLKYRQASNPEKSTAAISLVAGTALELASSITVLNHPPKAPNPDGEITAPLHLTWNPTPGKGAGVVSLFELYKSKWDKLEPILQALKSKELELDLSITTPDDEAPKKLSDKSTVMLLSPKAKASGARAMLQPRAGLLFQFDMDFYVDSHIWVKLCEKDTIYDDVCKLKGTGKNNWRLYPLLGTSGMHTKRQVFIPGPDILWSGAPESAYQFYLRLSLLDSDSCELDLSKDYLSVPSTTLEAIRKG